jgi:hypothetical protein
MCSRRAVALSIGYRQSVDIADDALYLYDALEQGHTFLALPEVLFEWRVAVAGRGAYATLSGSQERCHHARGLLLAEWINRPALRDEVRRMLDDPGFLTNFCMFAKSDVVGLQKLLCQKPANGKALGEYICSRATVYRPSLGRLLGRQLRAIRVMGLGHVLNFLWYKKDKRQLGRKLAESQ